MSRHTPSLWVCFFVAFTAACTKAPPPSADESGSPLDAPLMAYLSMARALHHEATLEEDSGSPAKALAAMDRLLAAPRPANANAIPEVEEVLADAFARSTELAIHAGDLDRGARYAKEGLTHASGTSYFRGHLLEVDGLLEEARVAALRDAGKSAEAEAAKTRAIEKLEAAVRVQQSVIGGALAADAGASGRPR